jgi:hypothetical protein
VWALDVQEAVRVFEVHVKALTSVRCVAMCVQHVEVLNVRTQLVAERAVPARFE